MDLYDILVAKALSGSGGGGGGGCDGLELISTTDLGHISTEDTNGIYTGVQLTIPGSVLSDYDMLIFASHADEASPGHHLITAMGIFLTAGLSIDTKNGTSTTNYLMIYKSSSGNAVSKSSKNGYGVYPYNVQLSGGDITCNIFAKYSTTYYTIDANYTVDVYGLKLYEKFFPTE